MRRSRKPFRGFLLRRGFESLPLRPEARVVHRAAYTGATTMKVRGRTAARRRRGSSVTPGGRYRLAVPGPALPSSGKLKPPPGPTTAVRTGMAALALGALGVVFGDIGTSPLYALQTVFTADGHRV